MADDCFKMRFAALLQSKGMSQKEIAEKTNLTEGAISHYLKGDRVPRGAILLNIANALGTSTDYLKGKADDVRPAGADDEVKEVFRLVARNAASMSAEEKARLARILFGGNK